MESIKEVSQLLDKIENECQKNEEIIEYADKKIIKINNRVGQVVNRIRIIEAGKRTDNEKAMLHDLYEISSSLLDLQHKIHFA